MTDTEPRAALAQAPAPVRVKPLVWGDFGDWGAKASAYYQANYLIQFWKGREQFEVALSYPGYQTGFDGERWHPSLNAAKAAAQADYEARILAALEAPDAGVVAELVEALREARADLAAYVDHDYPPETCATYPSVARQHHRDMELCRRIDAVLAKLGVR